MGNSVLQLYSYQWEIVFLLISTKQRSLDPILLYCIDSDWTPLSIGGKKLVSLGTTKFGVLCYIV